MHRHQAGADGDFYIGIPTMERKETRQYLVIRNKLVVEVNSVSLLNLDRDIIFDLAWRGSNCSRQIDPNTFHMGLAQAHHHETVEQKKHDIAQRNDLNACSLVRNW